MPKRVKRTRNGNTWTESEYWSRVRSSLRRTFRYWKPAIDAKLKARRPNTDSKSRCKWEYCCGVCGEWFKEKEIEIDHIIAVGSLKCPEDLIGFLERLTPEDEDAFMCLCKPCHRNKTNKERMERSK